MGLMSPPKEYSVPGFFVDLHLNPRTKIIDCRTGLTGTAVAGVRFPRRGHGFLGEVKWPDDTVVTEV